MLSTCQFDFWNHQYIFYLLYLKIKIVSSHSKFSDFIKYLALRILLIYFSDLILYLNEFQILCHDSRWPPQLLSHSRQLSISKFNIFFLFFCLLKTKLRKHFKYPGNELTNFSIKKFKEHFRIHFDGSSRIALFH